MRLYWEVARRGFRRYATYRAATFAGVFTNTVFGFLRAAVLLALYQQRARVGEYLPVDSLTYVWLGQGLLATVMIFGWIELALRIRSGEIATDLSRPLDVQGYWLAHDLGRAAFQAVYRGIPPFLIGLIFFELRIPKQLSTWVIFVLSVGLAVCVSFAIRFLLNLTAFWLLDYRGVITVSVAVTMFLSGFVLPVTFFPGWLQATLGWLPFTSMVQIPIDVFLGKRGVGALMAQAAWALGLLAAGRVVLRAANRKLVVQGG